MKHAFPLLSALPVVFLLASCETTSISHVGRNPFYRGELAESDLLGIPTGAAVSDETIRATLARASGSRVRVKQGERILLVQSGASQPDPALSAAFGDKAQVSPFSGLPQRTASSGTGTTPRTHPSALRLAAAQAGAPKIVCVWGVLESARQATGLETVTWLPVVGEFIPGKRTVTRITLKGMVMDTATGAWSSISSDPVSSGRTTATITEQMQSARHIEQLKASAYQQLAGRMVQ